MNDYELRKQERVERLKERAAKARDEATQLNSTARSMADVIPFGQPILVGHHSEKRDRSYRARIENKFRKSYEASDKAERYERKAKAAESNRAISSDDPEASIKLKAKIEKLERLQQTMKDCNKVVKLKGLTDQEKVNRLAVILGPEFVEKKGEGRIYEILKPDFCGRAGFADYQLTNNGANIRRLKNRLADLENQEMVKIDWKDLKREKGVITEVEVVENAEENRIQLMFDGKPEVEARTILKRYGFRWSPRNMAWQRHLNNAGRFATQNVLSYLP